MKPHGGKGLGAMTHDYWLFDGIYSEIIVDRDMQYDSLHASCVALQKMDLRWVATTAVKTFGKVLLPNRCYPPQGFIKRRVAFTFISAPSIRCP